ncbi:hypothetical protein [Alicyclobacillus pomorum]|uniref:hypothetical protein n=1 Tax=Alicyclobacillus pomorum TaxID=204470 RepID=UPI00047E209B|nr:hypothetical protein [Alicyclobacillus pomorum]
MGMVIVVVFVVLIGVSLMTATRQQWSRKRRIDDNTNVYDPIDADCHKHHHHHVDHSQYGDHHAHHHHGGFDGGFDGGGGHHG